MIPDIVRDDDSAPFFDGTARSELLIKRCDTCGHFLGPTSSVCSACHGTDLDWTVASGEGTLVSWVVVHGRDETTLTGIVELAEGPWFDARLVGVEPGPLAVGDPVTVGFVDAGEEKVPVFAPRR